MEIWEMRHWVEASIHFQTRQLSSASWTCPSRPVTPSGPCQPQRSRELSSCTHCLGCGVLSLLRAPGLPCPLLALGLHSWSSRYIPCSAWDPPDSCVCVCVSPSQLPPSDLEATLERGDGQQSQVLLLLGVAHQVHIDKLLHLGVGGGGAFHRIFPAGGRSCPHQLTGALGLGGGHQFSQWES